MRRVRSLFTYKIFFLLFSIFLMVLPEITLAQDNPCDDPFNPPADCVPLDTYVWLLVIAAIIFGAIHLYRQQKTHSRA